MSESFRPVGTDFCLFSIFTLLALFSHKADPHIKKKHLITILSVLVASKVTFPCYDTYPI